MRLILIAQQNIPKWQVELINALVSHINITVSAIILINTEKLKSAGYGLTHKYIQHALVSLLDRRKVKCDAFQLISLETLARTIASLNIVNAPQNKWPASDLLINLNPRLSEMKLAQTTGLPVWGIRFGKSVDIDSPLATSYEILTSCPLSCIKIISAHPNSGQLTTVYEAKSSTIFTSTRVNANQLAWKAVDCIPRLLQKKKVPDHSASPIPITGNIVQDCTRLLPDSHDIGQLATIRATSNWLFSRFGNKIKRKLGKEQWILASGKLASPLKKPEKLTFILPPEDRFWADPHLISYKDQLYVFFEELLYQTNRGHICCAPLGHNGTIGTVTPVIDRDYHLSYPFLFENEGNIFMIPETADNGTIELYKCLDFPNHWEHVFDIMKNVAAYDTTLHYHRGHWWLFTNMAPVSGMSSWEQLYLYYAKEFPTDTWTPHPANPIIDDVSSSRPAGRIFQKNGKVYRPSQDSSGGYGTGLNIMEINELSPEQYKETLCLKWHPHDFSRSTYALHTFSHVGETVFLDFQINRFPWTQNSDVV